ncbi:hypothetical protein CV959_24140 [Salmonella enterica]|nr:hypothetical protein CV959_24140 [Salmonella enterica]
MLIQSRPPGRLFYAPYRAMPHPMASFSHYEIGRDNTYGWRRYGRDNMTTNSMTTKINILRHSRRFFRCACKALLPAAP